MKRKVLTLLTITALCGAAGVVSVFAFDNDEYPEKTTNQSANYFDEITDEPIVPVFETENNMAVPYVFEDEKSEIWHKMLNSDDYFDRAKGSFLYSYGSINSLLLIEYQTDIPNSKAETHVKSVYTSNPEELVNEDKPLSECIKDVNDYEIRTSTADGDFLLVDEKKKTYFPGYLSVIKRENKNWMGNNKRVSEDNEGNPVYYYRSEESNTYWGETSLEPQAFAFGLLADFDSWDIDGTTEYAGEECYIVTGKTNESYGSKIQSETFELYVDKKTGCLLKLVGRDSENNLSIFIVTEKVEFDGDKIDIQPINTEGYTLVN